MSVSVSRGVSISSLYRYRKKVLTFGEMDRSALASLMRNTFIYLQ